MSIIEDQKIRFVNMISFDSIYKAVDWQFDNLHSVAICHISQFKDVETVDEIIGDVSLAIEGQLEAIEDTDVSNELQFAFIIADGIEFWDDEVSHVQFIYPLAEFKEMLIAWRDFLTSKPFNGDKVRKNRRNSNL